MCFMLTHIQTETHRCTYAQVWPANLETGGKQRLAWVIRQTLPGCEDGMKREMVKMDNKSEREKERADVLRNRCNHCPFPPLSKANCGCDRTRLSVTDGQFFPPAYIHCTDLHVCHYIDSMTTCFGQGKLAEIFLNLSLICQLQGRYASWAPCIKLGGPWLWSVLKMV